MSAGVQSPPIVTPPIREALRRSLKATWLCSTADCRHCASGANRDRTGDLVLAKSPLARRIQHRKVVPHHIPFGVHGEFYADLSGDER
jgi:hypothetical protein